MIGAEISKDQNGVKTGTYTNVPPTSWARFSYTIKVGQIFGDVLRYTITNITKSKITASVSDGHTDRPVSFTPIEFDNFLIIKGYKKIGGVYE